MNHRCRTTEARPRIGRTLVFGELLLDAIRIDVDELRRIASSSKPGITGLYQELPVEVAHDGEPIDVPADHPSLADHLPGLPAALARRPHMLGFVVPRQWIDLAGLVLTPYVGSLNWPVLGPTALNHRYVAPVAAAAYP